MPAIGSVHKGEISLRDSTDEIGRFAFYFDAITAVSLPGFLTEFGDFVTATDGITLGQIAQTVWSGDVNTVSNAVPTNPAAQRESKLLVDYWDTTTEKMYHLTVPSIDYSKLVFLPGGGDAVAFTAANGASTEIQDWVTAFEAIASPPDQPTHNVAVQSMHFVGRNS